MWAYRLNAALNPLGMTLTASALRKKLVDIYKREHDNYVHQKHNADGWLDDGDLPPPVEHHTVLDQNLKIARNMARALGWDTTIVGEPVCFLLPDISNFQYGIIITQATGNQRYVVSPVPLKFLEDHVSWNAHTSVEEVIRAQGALSDGKLDPPEPVVGEWRQSRKGNYYTNVNGANVTVFPSREGGFMAVIMNPTDDRKLYTRAFPNEMECADYVVKNFNTIIKPWAGSAPAADNPFAGVDWGDDD